MTQSTARLLIVFSIALVATAARGQNEERKAPETQAPKAVWAGAGFVGAPQAPSSAEPSVRIVYSDEEVVIVDLPENR